MPAAIPFVGALFTGTGLFAAGGVIAGGIASFTGSALIGGAIAGALGGALVGAAIGGLTSLVMGGDIGKGLLFGAIGGAVTGGIGGFLDASAMQAATTYQSGASGTMFSEGTALKSLGEGGGVMEVAAEKGVEKAATTGIVGKLGEAGTAAAIEGGIGLIGSTLSGMGEQERWEQQMEMQIAEAEKNRQFEMKALKMKLEAAASGGGGGSAPDRDWAAELAENRRQFDLELAQRKEEFQKTLGIRKDELYAPMEYQKQRVKKAGSALASVKLGRGQYKERQDTIKQQLQGANEYPDTPVPEEDDR